MSIIKKAYNDVSKVLSVEEVQHPLLYLGLLGFDAQSEQAVRAWLAENTALAKAEDSSELAHPIWELASFQEADALLVCGASAMQANGMQLRLDPILRQHDPDAPLEADLQTISMPYALSDVAHLRALGMPLSAPVVFSVLDGASLRRALQHFEAVLRPLRSLYVLAAELTQRRDELHSDHTYHLEHQGTLNAIIDPANKRVLMRPEVRPIDIHLDAWIRRPLSANFAPAHFLQSTLDEVIWVYAMHAPQAELPKRYTSKTIYFRRQPRVRESMFYPRHAGLIDCLSEGQATLALLQDALPKSSRHLERDLMGLYLTRCVSTLPSKEQRDSPSSLPGSLSTLRMRQTTSSPLPHNTIIDDAHRPR